jgi:MprA protease rhombosortase-interaction domain-containing protein
MPFAVRFALASAVLLAFSGQIGFADCCPLSDKSGQTSI